MAAGARAEPRSLRRYVLRDEHVVVVQHQHWGVIVEAVASTLGGLVLAFALDTWLGQAAPAFTNLVWMAWLVLVGRMFYLVVEWRHDWFVATDKRLLLFYGLVTQKVAMMPLGKVTDMSYVRSPLGRVFGYGKFVLESAGQDQALHTINWVPDPDETYRRICTVIFPGASGPGLDDEDAVPDAPDAPDAPPPPRGDGRGRRGGRGGDGRGGSGGGPISTHAEPYHGPVSGSSYSSSPVVWHAEADEQEQWSTAIPVRRDVPDDEYDEQVYLSPDLRAQSVHEADTGPIPRFEPRTGH